MKKFKDLLSEQIAADYKEKKDDEKEVKGYKPRSKGEEDFANMHTVDKVGHPVAEPEQHTGDRKGPKSDTGEEFDGPEKKGQELPMTYSQFMKLGGWGQSSARGADKSQGDMKPVMQGSSKVTESVELDEMKQKFALVDKDNKVVSTGSDERDLRLNRPSLQRKFGELKLVQIKKKQDIGYPLKEEDTKLDEAVKPGNVKLKSGESVMLSKDDAEAINDAMKELNSSNKKKMQDELMKDKKSFMSMVKFAKTAA